MNSFGSGMYGGGLGSMGYSGMNSGYGMGYNSFGGGFGNGYGGMNSMGMNGMMPGGPQDQSLTQTWNQSTAATFQVMESIVRAFGGLAQMLESAYMTTHSSFFGECITVSWTVRANTSSHGLNGRTVGQPQTNLGLSPGNLHTSAVDEDTDRQNYWPASTSRCDVSHTCRLFEFHGWRQRPIHTPRRHSRPSSTVTKTVHHVCDCSIWSTLSYGQTDPLHGSEPRRSATETTRNVCGDHRPQRRANTIRPQEARLLPSPIRLYTKQSICRHGPCGEERRPCRCPLQNRPNGQRLRMVAMSVTRRQSWLPPKHIPPNYPKTSAKATASNHDRQ